MKRAKVKPMVPKNKTKKDPNVPPSRLKFRPPGLCVAEVIYQLKMPKAKAREFCNLTSKA